MDIDNARIARIALACLDLTSLNDNDDKAAIDSLCAKAVGPHGRVAAVCVWPQFVAQAREQLPPDVRVAAVANFPDGSINAERAVAEAKQILDAGGDEVDLVLPYRAFIAGDRKAAASVVDAVRQATLGRTLKLIIESGELKDEALIRAASELGIAAGVDFLKTSTGKSPVSATIEAARTMLAAIAASKRAGEVGFKASGGIRRVADAAAYIAAAHDALGAAALVPARLRFGASGLLGDIESVLSGGSGAASQSSY